MTFKNLNLREQARENKRLSERIERTGLHRLPPEIKEQVHKPVINLYSSEWLPVVETYADINRDPFDSYASEVFVDAGGYIPVYLGNSITTGVASITIPDYLLPFVKLSVITKSVPGAMATGVTEGNYKIFRDWGEWWVNDELVFSGVPFTIGEWELFYERDQYRYMKPITRHKDDQGVTWDVMAHPLPVCSADIYYTFEDKQYRARDSIVVDFQSEYDTTDAEVRLRPFDYGYYLYFAITLHSSMAPHAFILSSHISPMQVWGYADDTQHDEPDTGFYKQIHTTLAYNPYYYKAFRVLNLSFDYITVKGTRSMNHPWGYGASSSGLLQEYNYTATYPLDLGKCKITFSGGIYEEWDEFWEAWLPLEPDSTDSPRMYQFGVYYRYHWSTSAGPSISNMGPFQLPVGQTGTLTAIENVNYDRSFPTAMSNNLIIVGLDPIPETHLYSNQYWLDEGSWRYDPREQCYVTGLASYWGYPLEGGGFQPYIGDYSAAPYFDPEGLWSMFDGYRNRYYTTALKDIPDFLDSQYSSSVIPGSIYLHNSVFWDLKYPKIRINLNPVGSGHPKLYPLELEYHNRTPTTQVVPSAMHQSVAKIGTDKYHIHSSGYIVVNKPAILRTVEKTREDMLFDKHDKGYSGEYMATYIFENLKNLARSGISGDDAIETIEVKAYGTELEESYYKYRIDIMNPFYYREDNSIQPRLTNTFFSES